MTDIKKLDIFNTYNLMKRVSFFVFNKLRGQERIMTEDEWGWGRVEVGAVGVKGRFPG